MLESPCAIAVHVIFPTQIAEAGPRLDAARSRLRSTESAESVARGEHSGKKKVVDALESKLEKFEVSGQNNNNFHVGNRMASPIQAFESHH